MQHSVDLLRTLIAFATVSRDSNLALIAFVQDFLAKRQIDSTLVYNEEKTKANLFATLGPSGPGGLVLSGHTDVVPVDGQDWSSDPFVMREADGKLYGRGSADMKGFIACVLAMIERADLSELKVPLHVAFSYDEEIGCIGVRGLLEQLRQAPERPRFCIIGEPTSMQVMVAHKGKISGTIVCHGVEGHSSLTPEALNAIHLAADVIHVFRNTQAEIIQKSRHDHAFEVPYTTLHIGMINGGTQLNIVPNKCTLEFEIRHLPEDDPEEILDDIKRQVVLIVAAHKSQFPTAAIEFDLDNINPAMNTPLESDIIAFVQKLTGANSFGKVAFATEGGLFTRELGVETIIMGPGDISVAHKPDEYIPIDQLDHCDRFLDRLVQALS